MRIPRLLRTSSVRFAALYTVVFCASVALLLGSIYDATVRAIDLEIDTALETELSSLREVHARLGQEGLIDVLNERSTDPATANNAYLLVDGRLQPLAGNLPQWPLPNVRRAGAAQFEVEEQVDGEPRSRIYRARTVTLPDAGRLLVAHDVQRRARMQQIISDALGWGLAATLALGVAGGVLTGRALLRRMGVIADISERIMDGNLSERIPLSGAQDELDRLALQLNRMLDRIEQLVDGMRTVSDNLAHDLRAPLTRLRGAIESALLDPPDASRYRKALDQALFETNRVLNVFNALMSIAQARSGILREQMESLDLAEVVAEAADLYEPALEARGLRLEWVPPPGKLPVRAHRQLLAQALVNLLDNAVKFTPAGGTVRVSAAMDDHEAVACVADDGPGISADTREKVLAPFVRGDHTADVAGAGLGLSLVAAVAALHRATLKLADNSPGTRVSLALPLDTAAAGSAGAGGIPPQ